MFWLRLSYQQRKELLECSYFQEPSRMPQSVCLSPCMSLKPWAHSFKTLKEKGSGSSLRGISELAPCILKAHTTGCVHASKLNASWTILWH